MAPASASTTPRRSARLAIHNTERPPAHRLPASAWWQELLLDSKDSYNRIAPYILPLISLYLALAVLQLGGHLLYPPPPAAAGNNNAGTVPSVAADSGLRMTLSERMPPWMVAVHGMGATSLFGLVLYQKHTVVEMAKEGLNGPAASAHKCSGYICLLLVFTMDVAGFALCRYSAWQHFETFSYAFAFPWLVWIVAIYTTSGKRIRLHRFFGNFLVKGCISVPLARMGGAVLQRTGWEEELGYYVGIGGVSLAVFGWLILDSVAMWNEQNDDQPRRSKDA
eukprot:gene15550-25586_t